MLQHFRRSVDVLNLLVRSSVFVCVCDYFLRDLLTHVTSTRLVGNCVLKLLTPAKDIHKRTPANRHSWLENEPNLKMYFLQRNRDFAASYVSLPECKLNDPVFYLEIVGDA